MGALGFNATPPVSKSTGVGILSGYSILIAQKRILKVLEKRRVSYSRHLEIKISEAGPTKMRVEPHAVSAALKILIKNKRVLVHSSSADSDTKLILPTDFGKSGDQSRLDAFINWRDMFVQYSQKNEYCGLVLERLVFETALQSDLYTVLGSGPEYGTDGLLFKPKGSELLHYDGKTIYGAEHGAGFDLFLSHKATHIPIGIEAKNIRQWIYPASEEVWRMIARACTLDCLPVIVARKISFIAYAGFFAHFGILGFQTHFQYMSNHVNAHSKYKFKNDIIHKDRLGFADMKLVKSNSPVPENFTNIFNNVLDSQVVSSYEKFMKYKDLLKKYAIDYRMSESSLSQKDRFRLYKEFTLEAEYTDVEAPTTV